MIEETIRVNYLGAGVHRTGRAAATCARPGPAAAVHVQLLHPGPGRYSLYSSTKAAVVNLTQALADEWAPIGIRVNCVNPERTPTPMRTNAFGEEPRGHPAARRDVALASIDVLMSEQTGHVIDVRRDPGDPRRCPAPTRSQPAPPPASRRRPAGTTRTTSDPSMDENDGGRADPHRGNPPAPRQAHLRRHRTGPRGPSGAAGLRGGRAPVTFAVLACLTAPGPVAPRWAGGCPGRAPGRRSSAGPWAGSVSLAGLLRAVAVLAFLVYRRAAERFVIAGPGCSPWLGRPAPRSPRWCTGARAPCSPATSRCRAGRCHRRWAGTPTPRGVSGRHLCRPVRHWRCSPAPPAAGDGCRGRRGAGLAGVGVLASPRWRCAG